MAWPEPALFFAASTTTLSAFLSAGQYTFLPLWVCAQSARNSFCATVLARYFRLGGRPPGGRNLWRTFDVPNPRNNLPERRPPQPITRSAIAACECAAPCSSNFYLGDQGFLFSRFLLFFFLLDIRLGCKKLAFGVLVLHVIPS